MRLFWLALALVASGVAGVLALGADARPRAAQTAHPLVTADFPDGFSDQPRDSPLVYGRIRAAGGSAVRLGLSWNAVVRTRPPTKADARDPAYRGYNWAVVDRQVRWAVAARLKPMLTVYDPPLWAADRVAASNGPENVDLTALGDFVHAAATRYSGRFGDVPRVPYWVVWNEANLGTYLNPQFVKGKPVGGVLYRRLSNVVAHAIHGVRADNLVVAGATAPFTAWTKNTNVRWGMGPLQFMRTMLCLSRKLKPTCSARAEFDVWAHHPYTSGGPNHHAFRAEDVSLGDLPEMKAVLDAAIRYHRIISRHRPQFWVTEFAWDTNPPDHGGVPSALAARWTAEALYRMWSSGVTLATWYAMRDGPYPSYPFQGGLYFRGKKTALDRPKPSWVAFRFPFVAYTRAHGVFIWGRTPTSRPGRVRVEQQVGSSWRVTGVLAANRYGIFTGTIRRSGSGPLRAEFGQETTNTFSLSRPKDRFFYPFGDWHP